MYHFRDRITLLDRRRKPSPKPSLRPRKPSHPIHASIYADTSGTSGTLSESAETVAMFTTLPQEVYEGTTGEEVVLPMNRVDK